MNRFFRGYNRVKYLARIKHWRGRSVHSPFLYRMVREGFMKSSNLAVDESLMLELLQHGFSKSSTQMICRLYNKLGSNGYTFSASDYKDEGLIIIDGEIDMNAILEINSLCGISCTKCVVVKSIYQSKSRYRTWKQLSATISSGVAVDLYHTGVLFLDRHLNKQYFKMRP